jgi:hypothetical protein
MGLAFRTMYGVFGPAEKGKTAYARVVFLADTGKAAKFELKYSKTDGSCARAGVVSGAGSNASNAGHWVEARFTLPSADLAGGSCTGGGGLTVIEVHHPGADVPPTVFSTVEVVKQPFSFDLSPWKTDARATGTGTMAHLVLPLALVGGPAAAPPPPRALKADDSDA